MWVVEGSAPLENSGHLCMKSTFHQLQRLFAQWKDRYREKNQAGFQEVENSAISQTIPKGESIYVSSILSLEALCLYELVPRALWLRSIRHNTFLSWKISYRVSEASELLPGRILFRPRLSSLGSFPLLINELQSMWKAKQNKNQQPALNQRMGCLWISLRVKCPLGIHLKLCECRDLCVCEKSMFIFALSSSLLCLAFFSWFCLLSKYYTV